MLIDSLQNYIWLLAGMSNNPALILGNLQLNGDYPAGTYEFTCLRSYSLTDPDGNDYFNGATITMKIR